ncbi:alpha/beta fold hydrolase [Dactylosporangium sp. NPDC000521]|uniref:alpha/beta fold hydrolase n=1 Tax=Dactylosporangium sp. NPDC000521 TaxID=3363975 RepID=UPI0036B846A9
MNYVLVHSPLLGPASWAPVAALLDAAVPSLLGGPPSWPAVVQQVLDAAPPGPVILVAHSNAGYFMPAVAGALPQRVAACVFVDAALPARTGPTPIVAPKVLEHLRDRVVDGLLPPWTTWWPGSDLARLIPDPRLRQAVEAEQPRIPLWYYEQRLPVPAGWDTVPCGYLQFSAHYAPAAAEAQDRGWLVEHLPGEHLHQLVDPRAVTDRLTAMATALSGRS